MIGTSQRYAGVTAGMEPGAGMESGMVSSTRMGMYTGSTFITYTQVDRDRMACIKMSLT